MWITRVSIRNPVFATMLMLALVVLGAFSLQRMKVDQFPRIDLPVVVVLADYPGAAPGIVEAEVTRRIEEAVNAVSGIANLRSRSLQGQSLVIIEFGLHVDGRRAAEDVRERVAAVRPTLRPEVKEPRVLRFDPASRAIWSLAVLPQDANALTPAGRVQLTSWADQVLRKRLENVQGVGAVTIVGGTRREINLYLDPQAMQAHGVTTEQVVAAVRGENQELPLGVLRSASREQVVQLDARIGRPEDFGSIIVARRAGVPVRLDQVARVQDGAQELESLALYNGERTLLLSVQKAQDENTIDTVDGLHRAVRQLRAELPPGVRLEPIYDGSRQIRVAVDNVRRTLIEGAALTILIVFLFLNSWRSTVITGLTLPIALVGTFFFMHLFGFSVNTVTLMALSLCVGLLIDDAIVVRENIVRHLQMGKAPGAASLDGTHEIGLAVLATTFSIVAVFLPIGFMGGVIGKFFHEFGITIVVAVLISMFVSFTLDPMLSSVWHDPAVGGGARGGPRSLYDRTLGRVTGGFERATEAFARGYQRILRWSLAHRMATLAAAGGIFAGSVAMVPLLGTEFVPSADYSELTLSFQTPVGSALELTEAKARQVDAIVRELPEVRHSLATLNTANAQGTNTVSMYVRLHDLHERRRGVDELARHLRERLRAVPGITLTHVGQLDPVGGNKPVEFSLRGPDLAQLARLSAEVRQRVRDVPGLVDLDSSLKPDRPMLMVDVRRDAASDLGVSVAQIAPPLRTLLAGQLVGNWRAPDDQTYDVNVRLAPALRELPSALASLPLTVGSLPDGSPRVVRLAQVAELRESAAPQQINRRALAREVAFSANVQDRSAGEVVAGIRERLADLSLPPGYEWQFTGSARDMAESFDYALSALVLGVVFIYMILASQFRSFLQPLALMSSLPLTLIGVVLALMMFRSSLSLFSVIGIVMLMGLVTKNAILLVDFAIRARDAGMERTEALLAAARVRLRPILMTTLAMVFGMVPLAFAMTEGSQQRAPMGQAVIGGVITSSLLTLVVVPVVYCVLDDLARWARGQRGPAAAGADSRALPASRMDGLS